jgi:hypothetical protein
MDGEDEDDIVFVSSLDVLVSFDLSFRSFARSPDFRPDAYGS